MDSILNTLAKELWEMVNSNTQSNENMFYFVTANVGIPIELVKVYEKDKGSPMDLLLTKKETEKKLILLAQIYDQCHKQKTAYAIPYSAFLGTFHIYRTEEYYILRRETDRDVVSTFVGKTIEAAIKWTEGYWKQLKNELSELQKPESGNTFTEYCVALQTEISNLEILKKGLILESKKVPQDQKA